MKKVILLLCSMAVFCSCSNDDSTADPQEDFFRLEEGNLWVYKRYYSNDNITYSHTTYIDSVRVQGDSVVGNYTYKKVVHNQYDNTRFTGSFTENLRVDGFGHLVNSDGLVLHPGTDNQYQYSREVRFPNPDVGNYTVFGNVNYQLLPNPIQVNVEGSDYLVHSYYGNFISTRPEETPDNYVFFQYKQGLGFVNTHCAGLSGNFFYEDRLVSYDID
ncbi:hypothetical protein [Flavobacterium pedocola]